MLKYNLASLPNSPFFWVSLPPTKSNAPPEVDIAVGPDGVTGHERVGVVVGGGEIAGKIFLESQASQSVQT